MVGGARDIFLAGATVGLNRPVMVLRDERLLRFYINDLDCHQGEGGGGAVLKTTQKTEFVCQISFLVVVL